MLALMKQKAVEWSEKEAKTTDGTEQKEETESINNSNDHGPMYNGIIAALQVLKPTFLELTDTSAQHEGHAGAKGFNGESHFILDITSTAFEGLNLVQRHKLIYTLLGEIMPKIHALQIKANTPPPSDE